MLDQAPSAEKTPEGKNRNSIKENELRPEDRARAALTRVGVLNRIATPMEGRRESAGRSQFVLLWLNHRTSVD